MFLLSLIRRSPWWHDWRSKFKGTVDID